MASPPILIGIDTGGTFTDLIAFVGNELRTHKVLSTPDNPAVAVLRGLHELLPDLFAPSMTAEESVDKLTGAQSTDPSAEGSRRPEAEHQIQAKTNDPKLAIRVLCSEIRVPDQHDSVHLTYSSTVATNALLERKGANVLLLTTAGFEDLIEIGRQNRPELYALEPRKPAPLVERSQRLGVDERMLFDGTVLRALQPRTLRSALRAVRKARPEAVAVCLLHSYANPAHEQRIGAMLRRQTKAFVSLSHELVSEYREYERLSTTVINAYVGPVMSRHLAELERAIGGRVRFRVLQSNGGAIATRLASREAVRTCLSGPAGGVIGAGRVAADLGLTRVITFDMGGTSTDVSVINAEPRQNTEWQIGGLPVKVSAIDIHTVGAGGGSLARIDAGGVLKVGPESAGASPGPACYGRGTKPTVTDANLVLGRVVADAFLDGRMPLRRERSMRAMVQLGRRFAPDTETAAEGVVRVVNASMERAIRRVSVERGHDPRDYSLLAFGGAGCQHACELADALGMRRVVVPKHPGLLSAWGAARADVQRDVVRTIRLTNPTPAAVRRLIGSLIQQVLRDLRSEGVALPEVGCSVDVRYAGQSYEISVPLAPDFRAAFHLAHQRLYGYADPERDIEVVNARVSAIGRAPALRTKSAKSAQRAQPLSHRVYVGGRWQRAQIWQREYLMPAQMVRGPAIIVEFSATTFVPPAWRAKVHRTGHLLLERP